VHEHQKRFLVVFSHHLLLIAAGLFFTDLDVVVRRRSCMIGSTCTVSILTIGGVVWQYPHDCFHEYDECQYRSHYRCTNGVYDASDMKEIASVMGAILAFVGIHGSSHADIATQRLLVSG